MMKDHKHTNERRFHNLKYIENITSLPAGTDEVQSQAQLTDDVSNTIPQPDENVKVQHSIPEKPSDGQKRTFIEWLKDIWNKIFGKNKAPKEFRHIEKLFSKALTEVKDRLVKQGERSGETATEDATFSSESDVQSLISKERRPFYNQADKAFAALYIINRSGNYISDVKFVKELEEGKSYDEPYSKAIDELRNKYSKKIADWLSFADGTQEHKLANLFYSDPEGFVKEMYTPPLQSRTSKLYKRLLSYYENGGKAKEYREPIYIYSEEQYNAFGWVTYERYVTPSERDQAFSNFADYKERGLKFKETEKGEVIFPVGDKETTIVFIDKKSNMTYPNITRVIKIYTGLDFYDKDISEELFKYDGTKYKTISNKVISNYIRQEFFIQHTRRDGSSFVEYSKRRKDAQGNQTSNSSRGEQQDGGRSDRSGEEAGRTSESGNVTEEVQSSIPEKSSDGQKLTDGIDDVEYLIPEEGGLVSYSKYDENAGKSIPERTKKLRQDFVDGKIGYTELVEGEARLMEEARRTYGTIEEGEKAKTKGDAANETDGESDVQFAISEKKNIDYYTEKSYTDFGWVRYNDVLSAAEWKSITSNYAAYKHSKDKYVTTRFGEAIIHSQDYPNVLAYMTGPIKYPKVVKIVRINTFNSQEIVTEIRTNERNKIPSPYESIRNFYGDEILTISKARDYDDFWSIKGKPKGKDGQRSNTIGAEQQDGGRSNRSSEEARRPDEIKQYSIPEDGEVILYSKERQASGSSIPERTKKLRQDFVDGKIGYTELVEGEARLMEEARRTYGTIEEGENAVDKAKVPRSVEDGKNVGRFVRTVLETGSVSDALARQLGEKVLLGELSTEVATDKKAFEEAEKAIKSGIAKNKWGEAASSIYKIPSKNDIAIGERLLADAMKAGRTTEALEIASDLVDVYKRAGQVVQSASLLKKMTGAGRLVHLQRMAGRINYNVHKKNKDHPHIAISETLAEEF